MLNKKLLATAAIAKALQARKKLNVKLDESISPIDACEKLGIEVRLTNLPSMEGMYVAGRKPIIMLSSLRPFGRRNFTCAHEIGHHVMGHGAQFDELVQEKSASRSSDPNEFQADCFAAFLLMPKTTLENAMKERGYSYRTLDARQAFTMSAWLGVGYSTLINHLVHGLGLLSPANGIRLSKVAPRDIRKELLGGTAGVNLIVADRFWKGRAIDCEVGDYLLFPDGSVIEGKNSVQLKRENGQILGHALEPGIARVSNGSWSSFIRISPPHYVGRGCFRFEEEAE
jgi:Zn-dependent peptidase ImmA (M78 family)